MKKATAGATYMLVALVLGLVLQARAQDANQAQTPPASPERALKDRASAYYQAVGSGDRAAAYAFVAPESKNDFFTISNAGVSNVRILAITMPGTAADDTARVKIQESATPALFRGVPVDVQFEDSWKLIDGNWFIVLPGTKDMKSPFGQMSFDKQVTSTESSQDKGSSTAQSGGLDLEQIKKKVEASVKSADPDQYLMNLKKAQVQEQKEKAQDTNGKDKDKDKDKEKNGKSN